ncbi:MAG TPA: hypothetical protein VM677_24070 [Actinokineospora sp.]|nr:hypothetical protein [Actinokineospora sp.]
MLDGDKNGRRPIPVWGVFEQTPALVTDAIGVWVPAFRTWRDAYALMFEIRTFPPHRLADLHLLAYRDDEVPDALDVMVAHPDGRAGAPNRPGTRDDLAVMISGQRTDADCDGAVHVAAPPPDGIVRLTLSWPAGGLDHAVIDIPGQVIAEHAARVIDW